MATTVTRIPASFRFQSTLLDELKERAKASNRSLNNYVESLLLNVLQPASEKESSISTEIQARSDEAREEYKKGDTLHFESLEQMNNWLDSL